MDTAGVASVNQTADMIEKMTLDSQNKSSNVHDDVKKPSDRKFGPLHKGNVTNGHRQKYERSSEMQSGFMDQSMYYANAYSYYYGAYDGTAQDWDEYRKYLQAEGAEGLYGENGPLMYNPYVYSPYPPYSPATSPGPYMDGQQYAPRQYQQTASQPSITTSDAPFTPGANIGEQNDVKVAKEQLQKPVDCNDLNVKNGNAPAKSLISDAASNAKGSFRNWGPLAGRLPASGYPDPKFSFGNIAYRNQIMPPHKHLANKPIGNGAASGYINRMFSHPGNSGFGYISNGYDTRLYEQGWVSVGANYMPRGQGNGFYRYGNECADGVNELNRGPRAKLRNLSRPTSVKDNSAPQAEVDAEEKVKSSESAIPDSVNRPDFPVDYADAKFFIIKSYSEDDVHKSVKYNVWASTTNGNKKLDAAYKQAQEKSTPCPVFLFFSVNASGQFVGVAEMVGSVDFDKNLEYWQQDKWNGCFSLKWHIVKDVPNLLLKHIIIQSNENMPVTNSRDTQEVNLEQGLQMLKIFKEHSSRTSILDDFEFYESRQKAIQEKKVRIQFQKQVWEGKAVDLKCQEGKKLSLLETVSKLTNGPEHVTANGDS